jgi:hypothetical protein
MSDTDARRGNTDEFGIAGADDLRPTRHMRKVNIAQHFVDMDHWRLIGHLRDRRPSVATQQIQPAAARRYRAPVPVRLLLSIGRPALRVCADEVDPKAISTPDVQDMIDDEMVENDKIKRGLTAATWEPFEIHHRRAFVVRTTAFVERVGS